MTIRQPIPATLGAVTALLFAFPFFGSAQPVRIDFDQPHYQASLGTPIAIRTRLDAPVPAGLFSYGLRLVFDPRAGGLITEGGIITPAPLNFNGVEGPGALKSIETDNAAVKGTIDVFADPQVYFAGTDFVVFDISFSNPGEYELGLASFRTLGPTESIFVSGDGTDLDDLIQFGTATLTVVPEPGVARLVILGGFAWFLLDRVARRRTRGDRRA